MKLVIVTPKVNKPMGTSSLSGLLSLCSASRNAIKAAAEKMYVSRKAPRIRWDVLPPSRAATINAYVEFFIQRLTSIHASRTLNAPAPALSRSAA